MASNRREILGRLMGLETEYATLVRTAGTSADPPSRRAVYDAICAALARRQPTARGRFDPTQRFLASGGAVTAESHSSAMDLPGGLIEGATPEARSPQRLLACQRAQDQLLAAAAADCGLDAQVRLIKNSSDAFDHVYGCQENYEAEVARGLTLAAYWVGLALLVPLQLAYIAACLLLVTAGLALLTGGRTIGQLIRLRLPSPHILQASPSPGAVAATVRILRLIHLPLVMLLGLIARRLAFRRQRKYLTAFLVSRIAVTGTGHLDARGKYWLSAKARSIDSVLGMGGYRGERPIYVFGHWLEQVCGQSLVSLRAAARLWRRRQRLQIGLSDSNIADMAEYLKVGTTALVLDLIEAGEASGLPVLRRPVESLHRLASDWNLITRVPTSRGEMSALEIQTLYFQACRRFVTTRGDQAPAEAWQILERWEEALDALRGFRAEAQAVRPALGKIDWLTKRWMLDQMSPAAAWAVRKKVDLRYHELSEDGYFQRICDAVPSAVLTDRQGVERATRLPPTDSPAGRRGHLIREFGGSDETLRVSWSHVVIGSGRERRVVSLAVD